MIRRVTIGLTALMTGALTLVASLPAHAQEIPPVAFSVDSVLVNRTGGITAMGHVDCTAAATAALGGAIPDYVNVVLTNVAWTANQAQGRRMITASLNDSQASPCWQRVQDPRDPGRCTLNQDGTYHPCYWDSRNYGSDGWQYGNGAFKPGWVHLDTQVAAGLYFDADNNLQDLGLFSTPSWTLFAMRAR